VFPISLPSSTTHHQQTTNSSSSHMSSSNASNSRYNTYTSDFESWLIVERRSFDEQFNPTRRHYARGTRYSPYPSPQDVWTRYPSSLVILVWLRLTRRWTDVFVLILAMNALMIWAFLILSWQVKSLLGTSCAA
jgi:hypothetical protein